MARLDDAISHLATALAGSIPSDDQIIMGHVRDALELLREHQAAERDQGGAEARREGGVSDAFAALAAACGLTVYPMPRAEATPDPARGIDLDGARDE